MKGSGEGEQPCIPLVYLDPRVRGFIDRSRRAAYVRGMGEYNGYHLGWNTEEGPLRHEWAISVARSFNPPAIIGKESVRNQATGEAVKVNIEGEFYPLKTVPLEQIFYAYLLALRSQPFRLHQGNKERVEFAQGVTKWAYEDLGFNESTGGNMETLMVTGRIARIIPAKLVVYSGVYSFERVF